MGWKRKLVITIGVLSAISLSVYYSYSSGWLEKTISTTPIPFEFFRVEKRISVRDQQIKDSQRKSIQEYKTDLQPVLSMFLDSENKLFRPNLNEQLDEKSWNKLLDPIYGVEFQYVGNATMSGLIQDKDGWSPLITLSIYNDSAVIRNITLKLVSSENGLKPEIVRNSTDNFAYSELPSDFNMSLVDTSSNVDQRFYENKIWLSAMSSYYPQEDLDKLKESDNNVKTKLLFIYSDSEVKQYHKYGTTNEIYEIVRSYQLDLLSSGKNMMLVPMEIRKSD